ncbi:hypothetical protein NUW58_g1936 [Xylaria curta]|uniref:Uncharacterized protein n=1 Tax=Xylaria curta TaxID=42375 RepID=A0ACC1PHZ8_9PEZI|nr:hypothetical protein NUW58_g1936 [Xylaria curta]
MFTVPKEPLRVVNAEPDIESERDVVVVDPERDEDRRDSEEYRGLATPVVGRPEAQSRPIPTPSPLGDEDRHRTSDSSEGRRINTEKEALRRELDAEWEHIESSMAIPETPQTSKPPRPQTPPQTCPQPPPHSESRILEDHGAPRRPPLLHRHHRISRTEQELSALTLDEQIDRLGAELQQTRSAAHTPISLLSHHSDADVLSAEAIRFERPSGSTSTLQITPISAGLLASRSGNRPRGGNNLQKSTDFRSESNLRGSNELRSAGNNTPTRRVRAMVEEFESKGSHEGSPAGSPVKGSPTRVTPKGTPTRGSPTRGR